MNGWTVRLSNTARKNFRQLPNGPRRAAEDVLEELEESGPMLVEAFRMRGYPDTWKVRFHHDDYRMIYKVVKAQKQILVKRMLPRPTAYEGLKR